MAIWTQILSWALICSLAQGFIVYAALWLILKLLPGSSAATKYKCSLAALSLLLLWFGLTLRQQLHYVAAGDAFPLSDLSTTGAAPLPGTFAGLTAGLPALPGLRSVFPYLAAAYLTGLVFMLLRLSGGIRQLAGLRTKGLEMPDAALYESLQALKLRLQLKRRVRLMVSVRARVPMVIGFLKPVILLPAASVLNLSATQLETILLHELAHIKRQDFLVNMLQTIAETILFFNPFVWLISGIIRREREYCCDDLVLAHTSERVSYARALTALAGLDNAVLAVAATGRPGHLMQRIRRIVELKKSPFSYSRIAAAVLILVLIIFTASRVSHSFAMVKSEFIGGTLLSGSTTNAAGANSE
ncbi:MAG TPA: M56 family metallopeptidase, partial [Chitinophagaceae bacterium]|nr:M56 family metallopeptidase [Chitinophagaceae bacterium]